MKVKPLKDLGLWIKDIGALVISDLHIGYEEALKDQGIYVPSQYGEMKRLITGMLERAEMVVVLGDIKHEFSRLTPQEWSETRDFLELIKDYNPVFIRGNHDNFVISILKKYGFELLDEFIIQDFLFFHGHKVPKGEAKIMIMGHEHPSIALKDEFGLTHRFKCFLFSELGGSKLIVMPAMHPLASGTCLNVSSNFLSPLLRLNPTVVELGTPYVVEPGETVKKFPKVRKLIL